MLNLIAGQPAQTWDIPQTCSVLRVRPQEALAYEQS